MLQSHDNNGSINLCEFAVTYALNVHLQKEPYIAEFFDHIIDSIFKNRITLNDWQTLLFSMEILVSNFFLVGFFINTFFSY